MVRRWGLLTLAGVLVLAAAPAQSQPARPAQRAEPAPSAPGERHARTSAPVTWRGDETLPAPAHRRLDLPPTGEPAAAPNGQARRAPAEYRFALSFVVLPVKGRRLGFSKRGVKTMTRRVGDRYAQQTDGRISFGFGEYRVAPKSRDRDLPCSLDDLDDEFRRYARYRKNPPAGYRDTVVVYLSPLRLSCDFAGLALIGGATTYLNGLDLSDPQRLQDWITAHELGHNVGLEHSSSFWLRGGPWDPSRTVSAAARQVEYAEYGDYLDVMGQPPRSGFVRGARFGRWLFDGPDLAELGVLRAANAPTVTASGTYQLDQLTPSAAGGQMLLGIPVRANGARTFWALEYRPVAQNAGLRYPSPWSTRAYGVRLLLLGHGARYRTVTNKTFHRAVADAAYATLPVNRIVKLGGGARVVVNGLSPTGATVTVTVAPTASITSESLVTYLRHR